MRVVASRTWMRWAAIVFVLVATTLVASAASAGGTGGDHFSRGMKLHQREHWDEAALRFIGAYQAGHRQGVSAYNAACALAQARRTDEAFAWLERAYDAGFDLSGYLDDDDDLQSLRRDSRFAALSAKVMKGQMTRKARAAVGLVQRYDALRAQGGAAAHEYDRIGRELLRAGRYDEAAKAFVAAAEKQEFPATALYNAACARSLGGDRPQALALLQRAVEQGFADPRHIDKDDDLDNIRGEPRFREIRALAQELEAPSYPAESSQRNAQTRREWRAALPKLEAAVKSHPRLGQTWFNLGFAAIALGTPDQAVGPFENAAALGYRKSTSVFNLACAHAMVGHVEEAFAALELAVSSGFASWHLLRTDKDLDSLRSDPRFDRFLDLADAHEHDRGS